MKSLASEAAWSKKFLTKVQSSKPLGKELGGTSKAEHKAQKGDPEKIALKELELEQVLCILF
jgi:hypothetical protein